MNNMVTFIYIFISQLLFFYKCYYKREFCGNFPILVQICSQRQRFWRRQIWRNSKSVCTSKFAYLLKFYWRFSPAYMICPRCLPISRCVWLKINFKKFVVNNTFSTCISYYHVREFGHLYFFFRWHSQSFSSGLNLCNICNIKRSNEETQ